MQHHVVKMQVVALWSVDNLGAYSIPSETGLLIPSDNNTCQRREGRVAFRCIIEVLSEGIE